MLYAQLQSRSVTIVTKWTVRTSAACRLPAAHPSYLTLYQETDIALYAGTDILLLGFDLTCNKSLERLRHWHYSFCACAAPKAVVVVGTKADLYRERSVQRYFPLV